MCDTKKCTKCGKELPLDQFHKKKSGRLGYKSICKYCNNTAYAASAKEWNKNNPEKVKAACLKWRRNNPGKVREYHSNWIKNNPGHKYSKTKHELSRRANDPIYKMSHHIRDAVRRALKDNTKDSHTVELLGCSIAELHTYLELLFLPGMSWDNYGIHGWHIDHIIPLSYFDLSDSEQQQRAWHYTNLQPLWAADNARKSNKIEERQLVLL